MNQPAGQPQWVTIERYYHPTDAHIAAGRVESEGIPVFLHGINHASANFWLANALGGIQLQVPAEFAATARSALQESREIASEYAERCPQCGGNDVGVASNSWKIAFFAVHLLSVPVPWRKERRHCTTCGAEWEARE